MLSFFRTGRIALAPSLAAVTAVVMLLLTVVTVQLVGATLAKQFEADIGKNLAELAYQTTDKLDRGMYERYREVQLMAQRYEITNPDVPVAAKRAVLESMQATHPYYAWIGLTDNQGKVAIATKGLLEGKDVSARPWFGAAYRGVHLHDVHEAVLLAKLLPNPTGEPKRFFDVAFPFHGPDGTVAGVFGTHLSWQWAANVERSVLRPMAAREGVDTLILSRQGAVLLGPKDYADQVLDQESFRRAAGTKNGSVIETWPDGRRYLVGYSQSVGHETYPGLGWVVLVRQPLDVAFKPVDALRSKILWSGLTAAAVVSLLVWVFARNITRPLATITRHADALRAGHAQEIPPLRSRLTEVQILRSALNSLLSRLLAKQQGLRELNATLETRVTERTTELHRAVEETRKGEQRVKAIIETALDAFIGADAQGRISDWNPRAEEIFSWTRAEALGRTITETIVPPRFRDAHDAGMRRFAASGSAGVIGKRLQLAAVRRDGSEFPVEMTIGLINAGDSAFLGAFVQDISVRKAMEDELARERELLEASERSLRTITNNVPVLIGHVDRYERYRFANATYEEWFGVAPGCIVGQSIREVMGETLYLEHAPLLGRSLAGETVRFEVALPADGGVRTVEITRIPDIHDGVYNGFYVLGADVSAARRHAEELERLARVDTLTGLANRRAYQEQLPAALARAQRAGHGIALMFLDVDRFKQVNDTLGHAAGDAVLQEFARRVKGAVRVTDTVCRLAGDEFTVILERLKSPDEAALVAAKILKAFEAPFGLESGERMVSTSIGVAFADAFPVDCEALGASADKALYEAKSAGRARFAVARHALAQAA